MNNIKKYQNYLFASLLLVTIVAISDSFYSDLQRANNEKMMLEHFKKQDILSRGKSPIEKNLICLLYTSPSPRDRSISRMPSSA